MTTIDSRPYHWPYHGALRPEQTALLVFSGDAALAVEPAALQRLCALLDAARGAGVTVVLLPRVGAPSHLSLNAAPSDLMVPRVHRSGFNGAPLDSVLWRRGLRDLLIVGLPFELGADCTMREANDRGYECLLVEDCCTALSAETFAGAVGTLQKSGGVFGASATCEALLRAFAELDAGVRQDERSSTC